jgi:hypothetical protein
MITMRLRPPAILDPLILVLNLDRKRRHEVAQILDLGWGDIPRDPTDIVRAARGGPGTQLGVNCFDRSLTHLIVQEACSGGSGFHQCLRKQQSAIRRNFDQWGSCAIMTLEPDKV